MLITKPVKNDGSPDGHKIQPLGPWPQAPGLGRPQALGPGTGALGFRPRTPGPGPWATGAGTRAPDPRPRSPEPVRWAPGRALTADVQFL